MRLTSILFILFLIIFGTTNIKADPKADSLLVELKKTKQDTIKIRIFNELSTIYTKINPDTAFYYVNQSIDLSNKLLKSGDNETKQAVHILMADSYTNLGYCYKALGDYEKAADNFKKSLEIKKSVEDLKGMANNYIDLGSIKVLIGKYEDAEDYYKKALEIQLKINDDPGLAKVYRNIGNVYYYLGDYDLAVDNYQKSLVLSEKINDLESVSSCCNNIGIIHSKNKRYDWALEYYNKSLVIKQKVGDKRGKATIYNNMGDVYFYQKKYDSAFQYYTKSLSIREEVKDTRGIAFSSKNIGKVRAAQKQFEQAEIYFQRSLKINDEIEDLEQKSELLTEMAKLYFDEKKYDNAIKFAEQSVEISKKLNAKPQLKEAYEVLAHAYENKNNINVAFKFYKLFIEMKDSIYSDEEHKQIQKETKYQVDKKQKEIETQRIKQEAEQKDMRNKMYLLLGGLGAMLLLAFVLFRNYKQKTKANNILQAQKKQIEIAKEEIEAQRDLVMEKNELILAAKKEIEDSIIYAKNIQHAVLPSDQFRAEILPEHFIFWRPRNIVSGDFFWMKKLKNFVVITIADCTGHGVPGAFMSMLGLMFLNEIVTTRSLDSSGLILNKLREKIKTSLHQSGKEGEAKDGMDISFFIIDTDTYELQYSGAFNPLYVVREKSKVQDVSKIETDGIKACYSLDESCNAVLFEIKADRQPIAIYSYEKPFTTNIFQLENGDCIYSFTDGYPDQFGGEEGKKLNAKRFKELFLRIYQQPIPEQYNLVDKNFYEWMGSMEQVDDVLLMGLKIDKA
jgi:tetratricopeptide (TPR) repeat protein